MSIRVSVKHVRLNYMEVLRTVVRQIQVLLTPIEHLKFEPHTQVCWLTFTCPHKDNTIDRVVGDYTDTLEDVKQSVSKKTIYCLMRLYDFELVDANYKSRNYAAVVYSLERESCSTVRERMSGVKEAVQPSALVIEQDCLIPCGSAFQIPQ